MVFNMGHNSTTSVHAAGAVEWLMHGVAPSHPNIVRFIMEFVSDIPDAMFDLLTPDLQELGEVSSCRTTSFLHLRRPLL
jgi:hypothetical protein